MLSENAPLIWRTNRLSRASLSIPLSLIPLFFFNLHQLHGDYSLLLQMTGLSDFDTGYDTEYTATVIASSFNRKPDVLSLLSRNLMLAFPADMAFSKAVRSVLAKDFTRCTNELLFMCLFMKVLLR